MKEQLISFETAKLAKEKGFDLKGYNFYQIDGEILINEIEAAKVNSHFYYLHDSFELYKNHNVNSLWCSASAQSLLQRWLRELSTPIIVTPTTDFCAWEVEIHHPDIGLNIISRNNEGRWINSYEEALEIGLQEALKLI